MKTRVARYGEVSYIKAMKTMKPVLLFSVLVLAACSQEPISIEEKVLMRSFASISAAQAYDHVCQKDSLINMKETDTPRANVYGNTQMLAYRIGWFMHERRPSDDAGEAAERLQAIQKLIAGKTERALKDEGCEGKAAQAAKQSFDLYTKNEPVIVDRMIDDEVVRNGGALALKKIPIDPSDKDLRKAEQLENATPEQREAYEAAAGDAMPIDTPDRAYPAWGEWVKKELLKSPIRPGNDE